MKVNLKEDKRALVEMVKQKCPKAAGNKEQEANEKFQRCLGPESRRPEMLLVFADVCLMILCYPNFGIVIKLTLTQSKSTTGCDKIMSLHL